MKKNLYLLLTALILSGCSMADIFDGVVPGVISPAGDDENAVIYAGDGQTGGFTPYCALIAHLMKPTSEDHTKAKIINDESQLNSVVIDEKEYTWPEIDFRKYSLIVGTTQFVGPLRFGRFRAVEEKDRVKLYVEMTEQVAILPVTRAYFAVLFPKLKDLPVEMSIWENYK